MKDPQLCLVRNKVAGHTCIDENSKRWQGKKTPSLKKKLEKVMVRVEETREIQKDFLSLSEKWGNTLRG